MALSHSTSNLNGQEGNSTEQGEGLRLNAVLQLIALMGKEAFTNWSKQQPGESPTQEGIEAMIAAGEVFGREKFQRMVKAEYTQSAAANLATQANTEEVTNDVPAPTIPTTTEEGDLPTPTTVVGTVPAGRRCTNCGTTETTIWRRAPTGQRECNACNLHRRNHTEPRAVGRSAPGQIRRRRRVRPVPDLL